MLQAVSLQDNGDIHIDVYVQPGARNTALKGIHDGAIKISVSSPPEDGKANSALIRFIADLVGVRPRQVEVVSGHSSRRKLVRLTGADVERTRDLLSG